MQTEIEQMETQCAGMEKYMAERCIRLRNALQAIVDHWAASDSESLCASEMSEIAEKALKVD